MVRPGEEQVTDRLLEIQVFHRPTQARL